MSLDLRRPLICLVTDRHRFEGRGDRLEMLVELASDAVEAGIDLLQIREAGLSDRKLFNLVRQVVQTASGTRTRVLVNDRIDIALAAAASGVHLKGVSVSPGRLRSWVPQKWIIGQSVHSVNEALEAAKTGAVDYLIAGTVFETVSKPGLSPIGVDGFEEIASATDLPTLAIGGVTREMVRFLPGAGAGGMASIGAFIGGRDELFEYVRGVRAEFDK